MSNLNNLSKIELQLILKNHVDLLKKTELIEMIKNLNLHKSDADNHKAFIDEAKAKIIKSKISREKDIKKVASLIVQPKIKPKTNTNENAWVKHLQYIKSIEDVSHQQAMKMAKDSKNKYFYNPKPKEVVKQKKEKKVNNTCGICEKVFFDKSGLNRHMQLHKIELSKIRGLIKRQEFFLKNNNVNPDDRKNAPDIIAELKARFLFIASHLKSAYIIEFDWKRLKSKGGKFPPLRIELQTIFINESGVNALVLNSKKPNAKKCGLCLI